MECGETALALAPENLDRPVVESRFSSGRNENTFRKLSGCAYQEPRASIPHPFLAFMI